MDERIVRRGVEPMTLRAEAARSASLGGEVGCSITQPRTERGSIRIKPEENACADRLHKMHKEVKRWLQIPRHICIS